MSVQRASCTLKKVVSRMSSQGMLRRTSDKGLVPCMSKLALLPEHSAIHHMPLAIGTGVTQA